MTDLRPRPRSRPPLAVAVGSAVVAGGSGLLASRRAAERHQRGPDPRSADGAAFDLEVLGVTHHHLATHDGGVLHVVEKGPADARPLVLLHGITLQARIWGYQLRDLSDRYRVLALDLRGHGESRPGRDGFGLSLLARDLRTVLDALDLHGAVVAGHSMGGMAVMRFCDEHADALAAGVAGVAFVATTPRSPFPPAVQQALQRARPGITALDRLGVPRRGITAMAPDHLRYNAARRAFGRAASPLHVRLTAELVTAAPPATMAGSGFGMLDHDAEAGLRATPVPALVIAGELDRLVPGRAAERLAAALPDSELHVLPGAGHQLMLERPDELAALLDRLAGRLPAR